MTVPVPAEPREQLRPQPPQRGGFPAAPARQSERPQTWAGTGKGEWAGRKGPSTAAAPRGTAVSLLSCPDAEDQPFPAGLSSGAGTQHRHLPDLYPTSLSQHRQDVTLPPACYFTIIILLLNQDNTTIKNNIVITCSTTNKFCTEPEQHISITNSSISIF